MFISQVQHVCSGSSIAAEPSGCAGRGHEDDGCNHEHEYPTELSS